MTTTGVVALETELKVYRDSRNPARLAHKRLDSMGLPQITGTSTASLMVDTLLWYGSNYGP
jgi:hypothetical protein